MDRKTFVWFVVLGLALAGCSIVSAAPVVAETAGATAAPVNISASAVDTNAPPTPVAASPVAEVPVATAASLLATETPPASPRPTLAPDGWKTLPVVPTVSARARQIYQRGLAQGNNPNAFSKVGDCQNVPSFFLSTFDRPGEYRLGETYAPLQATIDHFSGQFARHSLAVKRGFNVASVLNPMMADKSVCQPSETPLACEFRLNKPSIALISMETGWSNRPADGYVLYMRQILDFCVANGVVPIIGTKADNLEGNHSINQAIAALANEYDIPLWNFWLEVQPLPGHGIGPDNFHLTFALNYFDDRPTMRYGWPHRNLSALQALDAVWRGVSVTQ